MQLFIDDITKPLVSVAPADLLLAPEAAVWRIVIPDSNELAAASLTLRRYTGVSGAPFSDPVLETDGAGGGFAAISWIKADWGSARTVRTFELQIDTPSNLRVRVQIARGGGGWFSPPGPHTFDVGDGQSDPLRGSFPDTVADRIMFEFLHRQTGEPQLVTLSPLTGSDQPLAVSFGDHARDISLSVATKRDFFTHSGELAAGQPIELGDLLDTLAAETDTTLSDTEIVLELRAAVAGYASVAWSFAHTTIVRSFAEGRERRSLALPWGESVIESLALEPPGRPAAFELHLASESLPERLALAPAAGDPLGEAAAALCRPLYDNAQPLSMALEAPVVGVDLWARPLTDTVTVTVELRADDGGRPLAASGQEPRGTLTIDYTGDHVGADHVGADHVGDRVGLGSGQPGFYSIALEEAALPPVANPGDRFWLVVQVEAGELLWFFSTMRPAQVGTPRYRRADGNWLERTAAAFTRAGDLWAVTRLRVANSDPPPPIDTSLVLIAANGSQATTYALAPEQDGILRWSASGSEPGVPEDTERLELHLSSPVASTVTLSRLRFTYR